MEITRQDILLAALAASPAPFTVTHVGKLLYLIDHEAGLVAPTLARAHVGPAQHGVEVDAMALAMSKVLVHEGYVSQHSVFAGGFVVTRSGQDRGVMILNALGGRATEYFTSASNLLRGVSFAAFSAASRQLHPGLR
jgi:hypothetical protein